MSSNAKELSARLAALAKAREEKEARCKREEEQERLEEEVLQKELKRVEVEEKKRKEEEAEEKQRKEKEALAAAEAKKRVEAEQGKKRGRAGLVEVVIGTRMIDEKGGGMVRAGGCGVQELREVRGEVYLERFGVHVGQGVSALRPDEEGMPGARGQEGWSCKGECGVQSRGGVVEEEKVGAEGEGEG
jgi:hypothetical protein